jgi:cholesterol transport system auxiliary component
MIPSASSPIRAVCLAVLLTCLGLAGCASAPPTTFDLAVPSTIVRQASGGPQLVIAEPVALQTLDSDRIIVTAADGSVSAVPGAQWSDRLPRLVQTRLVQTFENAGRAVGRAGGPLAAPRTLYSDLRRFGIITAGSPQAVVEITAKMVDTQGGRIVASRIFRVAVPVGGVAGREAAAALDQAATKVFADIVRWSAGRG